ncbi:hypothetical protein CYMTET_30318 [Cymbomonas tetramitiformis]|uniref:Uncharacterized protein n=1 Tax=Cymbomonas tetramitiformis TaxID=36881 RepID=A0AAE0FJ38_9CHLO|nr:hypothetical protein CYMTET_30318 [Cymbomonas tetramitiformis]
MSAVMMARRAAGCRRGAGAQLLASTTSSNAATAMAAMSYVRLDQACVRVEELLKMAVTTNTYGKKFKGDDIVRANLLQALELADTDTEVQEELSKLMQHFAKCYNFNCTVSRLEDSSEDETATQAAQVPAAFQLPLGDEVRRESLCTVNTQRPQSSKALDAPGGFWPTSSKCFANICTATGLPTWRGT